MYRGYLTAEGAEAGPRNVAVLKEFRVHPECHADVPGYEVHIAASEAGGFTEEGEEI